MRDMPTDSAAWRRLAQHVEDERAAQGWTQADVAERGGFSVDRVQEIEKGELTSYRATTLGALERGLLWERGSVRDVLVGGEPRRLPADPRDVVYESDVVIRSGVPVGANVDPELLAELAESDPADVQRVKDFLRGIKAGRE